MGAPYAIQDGLHASFHLGCRDPKERNPLVFEDFLTADIARALLAPDMDTSIDLYREPRLGAVEIQDVRADGVLPPELEPGKSPVPNSLPQQLL